jgi:hypothetical protein
MRHSTDSEGVDGSWEKWKTFYKLLTKSAYRLVGQLDKKPKE